MNEAIKLAIEKGGYKNKHIDLGSDGNLYTFGERFHENELENTLVLDPLFWQALGKALGWKLGISVAWDWVPAEAIPYSVTQMPPWEWHALRYHELRLTDGDTEKFWNELYKAITAMKEPTPGLEYINKLKLCPDCKADEELDSQQ